MNLDPRIALRFKRSFWLSAVVATTLSGCSVGPSKVDAKKVQAVDERSQPLLQERLVQESDKLRVLQDELRKSLEQTQPPVLEPMVPRFNPLDAINVSLQANDEDVRNLLKAIADQAGLNLVLPGTLSSDPRTISLSLNSVPASQAFEEITKSLDLSGEVHNNMLVVQEFKEQVFDLDFLLTMSTADFNAGGDVFGASSTGGDGASSASAGSGSSGLRSSFSVSGRNTNDVNPYEQIDRMLVALIGESSAERNPFEQSMGSGQQPAYMLNRSTGTLFVRGRPSQLAAVGRLVEHYKSVLNRQVLIEAQILDIELNDQFSYGVDWNILRANAALSYASNPLTLGAINTTVPDAINAGRSVLIPSTALGTAGTPSLGIAQGGDHHNIGLDLMKTFGTIHILSNPSIRVRNTQPAVVSVGSNIRYIAQSSSNTQNGGGGLLATTASVVTSNVFDGVMLGVIPFVSQDGSIHLTINPMQTSVQENSLALVDVGSTENPLKISLPRVDFKGMTTSLSLNDGDMVIIGGLIGENGSRTKDGLPGISDIPFVGGILGGQAESTSARELVLVLRVQIL
ncbi:pilus (MSHA type) biogenesis protein MshL [Pseudomonas neustonica]|uniref:Pilus (MSHA type) biogenesis protein MshL n=1 Tax=Pseudomonas neustonica TaxID=2487346 RepID=A0ABX9XJM2_9PSED|nr:MULTISPECIES: pilus (MSHA type) biogenesis protein MshL [Pseudomonas]ROZ84520.1 pilus (MSHA type) biogenesis protein MshL [Pseudomonas sp. SSM44]ROZ86323.1 pilus (MSHA type) biogenesis protein MshL [Pseudomonas neustonica]